MRARNPVDDVTGPLAVALDPLERRRTFSKSGGSRPSQRSAVWVLVSAAASG